MRLTVNFEPEEFPGAGMTVEELLKAKRYSFPLIIVRIGGVPVDRAEYANARLKDGDEVELYHLVSGG